MFFSESKALKPDVLLDTLVDRAQNPTAPKLKLPGIPGWQGEELFPEERGLRSMNDKQAIEYF